MKKIFLMALLCLMFLPLVGCQSEEGTLLIRVMSIQDSGDSHSVILEINNETGYPVYFGRSDAYYSYYCDVTTTAGRFTCQLENQVYLPKGETQRVLWLKDCPGTITRISISSLRIQKRNEPIGIVDNLMIYDLQEDRDSGVTSFAIMDNGNVWEKLGGKILRMLIIGGVLFFVLLSVPGVKTALREALVPLWRGDAEQEDNFVVPPKPPLPPG